jgi:SAM-dependent methyltransferase
MTMTGRHRPAKDARSPQTAQPGSSSVQQPGYWWHRVRADLLRAAFAPVMGTPRRVLDVGSADGPSVGWMRGSHQTVSLDLFPDGLRPGEGVCGSVDALPFADASFEVVSAFDVVEHCADDAAAVAELARVLVPGGRLLLSVPAYAWAWSDHDVRAGHHRRYTRAGLTRVVAEAGLTVDRRTHAFAAVFPIFVAERLVRRWRGGSPRPEETRLPSVSPRQDRLLSTLSRVDRRLLARHDLPFGSSIFLAAHKPGA